MKLPSSSPKETNSPPATTRSKREQKRQAFTPVGELYKDGGRDGEGGGLQWGGKAAGSAHWHHAPAALEVKRTAKLIYCTD